MATGPNAIPFWLDPPFVSWDKASYNAAPDAWSLVAMGPSLTVLPGILEDGNIHWRKPPHRVIDRGRKPSTDGATPKIMGFGVAEFDLPMIIHTAAQLNALQSILPQIWPAKSTPPPLSVGNVPGVPPGNGIPGAQYTVGLNLTQSTVGGGTAPNGGKASPVVIYHPELALAQIGLCIVEKFTPPVRWNGRNDIKKYTIHCIEIRDATSSKTEVPKQVQAPPVNPKLLAVANPNTPPSLNGAGPTSTLA